MQCHLSRSPMQEGKRKLTNAKSSLLAWCGKEKDTLSYRYQRSTVLAGFESRWDGSLYGKTGSEHHRWIEELWNY